MKNVLSVPPEQSQQVSWQKDPNEPPLDREELWRPERELRKLPQTPPPCVALVPEQKREHAKHALRPRPCLTT